MYITASKLYDYIQCPHRVWRDEYGPQDEKIKETNPFVELLWQKGIQHEEKIVSRLGEFLNLIQGNIEERSEKTIEAMKNKTPLIYQGVIKYNKLLGIPDLLKFTLDGSYIPIDIKSGMGFEGADDEEGEEGKPKKHYAIQLCLYIDVLKKLGFAHENKGKIIDINGVEVDYFLDIPQGPKNPETYWDLYEKVKMEVGCLLGNTKQNKPALGGKCKLCQWYNSCKNWCKETKDLTNIFCLGRSFRDRICEDLGAENIGEFICLDIEEVMGRKDIEKHKGNNNFLYRIAKDNLSKSILRAKIFNNASKPLVYSPIIFPKVKYELFFDIEDDPTQNFVYLHGIYERQKDKEQFIYFLASENTREAQKKAWREFWNYINSLPQHDFAVYYYSPHEKTTYKNLRKQYPDVIEERELNLFFENPNVIDLYTNIIFKNTEWPLSSYSIKEIATYLGFKWRDETPSGALSIQWYNEFLNTGDTNIIKRILEYNEDDCKATMILKDAIESISNDTFPKID